MSSIAKDFLDPPRQKKLSCFCQDKFKTKMDKSRQTCKKSRFDLSTKTGAQSAGRIPDPQGSVIGTRDYTAIREKQQGGDLFTVSLQHCLHRFSYSRQILIFCKFVLICPFLSCICLDKNKTIFFVLVDQESL